MTYFNRLVVLAAIILGSPCLVERCRAVESSPDARPNIVFILADDLGFGDVQCLNPERGKIPTPHLDRLAVGGMTFTNAHSSSSVCTPTRYGLLTGRYSWRTRLQKGVLSDCVEPLISADRLTVPMLLKRYGYHTACVGKWHLGFTISQRGEEESREKFTGAPIGSVTRDGPLSRGFEEFFGYHHARMMRSVFENDRVARIVEPVDLLPLLAKRAARYIAERAKADKPFFLYLPLSSPHTPIVPSKEWQGISGLGDYGDFVMETDWAVGEVLAALDRADVARNTLIIFAADNGCSPAANIAALKQQGHFPSAHLRGYKADAWDGGHRVPFFARWPGKIKPGAHSAQLVCLNDLMATCAAIVGEKLPQNAGEDSVNILPLLEGKGQAVREAVVHHSIDGKFAVRQGRWKLILCPGSGGWCAPKDKEAKELGLPPVQLYDMEADPGETNNLHEKHPEVVERLTRILEKYVADGRSTPGKPQKNDAFVDIWKNGK